MSTSPDDNLKGALWVVVAALAATVMTVVVRTLAPEMDVQLIAFLRLALGLIVLAPLMARMIARRRVRVSTIAHPWLHLARGVLMGLTISLGFWSVARLELATATILFFVAPIFATVLAGPMLGESVGPRRWTAVMIGFLGAVLVLRPGFGALDPAMLAAMGSAAAFALALLIGKIATRDDRADTLLVSSTLVATVVTAPLGLAVWRWPGPDEWLLLSVLVATSSLRTYADIRGYQLGEAGFLAPFSYLRLLTVGFAGWLFFAEIPDVMALAGGGIIIASTLYISRRDARRPGGRKGPMGP